MGQAADPSSLPAHRSRRRSTSDPAAPGPHDIREAVVRLKRERLIAAAVDIFYEQGFGRTTLDAVAQRVGMTKPFIYTHFQSKTELLAEICARGIRASMDVIDGALGAKGSARDKLQRFSVGFVQAVLASQKHIAIYTREEKNLAPRDREAIETLRRSFDRKLEQLLRAGVQAGEFRVIETPIAALSIGGIASWTSVWFRPGGRLSADEVAQRLGGLILALVQAEPAH